MTRPTKMLLATATLGAALAVPGVVNAAADATLNKCWGQVTKQFAAFGGEEHAGLGEHASDPPGFTPGGGGRQGVGNVSKTDPDFGGVKLSEGAQGVHAIMVAPAEIEALLPEDCQGTQMLP